MTGHDQSTPPFLEPFAKVWIAVAERELGDRRHVRPVGHHLHPVGREVAGRDVVRLDGRHPDGKLVGHRLVLGGALDVRTARDLDVLGRPLVGGREDVNVIDIRP